MKKIFAEYKQALVESWNPSPEEEGSGIESLPDGFHQPRFIAVGYIVTNVDNGERNSWGACYLHEEDARTAVLKLITVDPEHANLKIFWSDVLIEKVDFGEPQPLTRPLIDACSNTNAERNIANSKDYIPCENCSWDGRTRHWYLKKE